MGETSVTDDGAVVEYEKPLLPPPKTIVGPLRPLIVVTGEPLMLMLVSPVVGGSGIAQLYQVWPGSKSGLLNSLSAISVVRPVSTTRIPVHLSVTLHHHLSTSLQLLLYAAAHSDNSKAFVVTVQLRLCH